MIDKIEMRRIALPLKTPFTTSAGQQTTRHSLILTVYAEGLVGWGECVALPDPNYTYETIDTATHILRTYLIPSLLKQPIPDETALPTLFRGVRGHPMAKAGLEQALWDMLAQRANMSMAHLLCQPYDFPAQARVPVGVAVSLQPTIAQTLEVIGQRVADGYNRVKLKIKKGMDVSLAQAVRDAFPDLLLMLDANSAYTLADVAILQAFDELDILLLEQPLAHDDFVAHAHLRPQLQTPLCLDECLLGMAEAQTAVSLNACQIFNIKAGRVGGWHMARAIHDLAQANHIGAWVGGMLETGIGRAGQLALASLPGFTLSGDISATDRYFQRDISTHFTLNQEDSTITVPTAHGLGIEIDHDYLAHVTQTTEIFS